MLFTNWTTTLKPLASQLKQHEWHTNICDIITFMWDISSCSTLEAVRLDILFLYFVTWNIFFTKSSLGDLEEEEDDDDDETLQYNSRGSGGFGRPYQVFGALDPQLCCQEVDEKINSTPAMVQWNSPDILTSITPVVHQRSLNYHLNLILLIVLSSAYVSCNLCQLQYLAQRKSHAPILHLIIT